MDTPTRQGLEAVLFLAQEPLAAGELAEVLEVPADEVEAGLAALAEQYERSGCGIRVRRAAGGWRMYTAPEAHPVLERWALAGRSGRLSQAALETLAVIAYKQPIGRQEVGDIRGVNADGAVRSLVARGLVAEVGRDEGPGQALLYGTTTRFLERLGIDDLDELPPLTEFLPESPAPDEPEPGAIREARRRIAQASAAARPTGTGGADGDRGEDDEPLPAPAPASSSRGDIDQLTDQLDEAARSAVDRLRRAVSAAERAGEGADDGAGEGGEDGSGDGAGEAARPDGPDPGESPTGQSGHDDG